MGSNAAIPCHPVDIEELEAIALREGMKENERRRIQEGLPNLEERADVLKKRIIMLRIIRLSRTGLHDSSFLVLRGKPLVSVSAQGLGVSFYLNPLVVE